MPPVSYQVVLVRPRDPNNIGAAARAMKNFGLSELTIVTPHPPVWEEARAAVGAEDLLARARVVATLAEAVAACTLVIGTADHTRLDEAAPRLTPARLRRELAGSSERVALVFGPEKTGLTKADLSFCHRLVSIPTQPDCPSMNLGQAVAICCYELTRDETSDHQSAAISPAAASAGDLEGLLRQTVEILSAAEFFHRRNPQPLIEELRQTLLRLRLTEREVAVLRGALRQIAWKLQRGQTAED
jgi:TrmH family RNA methyltransferase